MVFRTYEIISNDRSMGMLDLKASKEFLRKQSEI